MQNANENASIGNQPVYSRTSLLVFALICCLVTVFITWAQRDYQWTPTLPLPVALLTLGVVLPLGEFIRHRFKLSMRAMFAVLTVCTVLLGLFGARWNKARLQRNAVQSVRLLATRTLKLQPAPAIDFRYNKISDIGDDYVRTPEGWLVPSWLVNFLGDDFFFETSEASIQLADLSKPDAFEGVDIERFTELFFNVCKLGPEAIETIAAHRQLTRLSLCNCGITDKELVSVSKLPTLTVLRIENFNPAAYPNTFTAAGLAEVAKVKTLRQLGLVNSSLSRDAVKHLCKLSKLEYLDLSHNAQLNNDDAKRIIQAMPRLKGIHFRRTAIDEEVIPLLLSLPGLEWASITASSPEAEERLTPQLEERGRKPDIYFR